MKKETPTLQSYAELQSAFDFYNRTLFDDALPNCMITLQREKRTYGYFSSRRFVNRDGQSTTDEIAINPAYFGILPLTEILQTMVHEMVHAWQAHFGKPGRRRYHNEEWAKKMESVGLMPSSTGKPGGSRTGERVADYVIEGGLFLQVTEEFLSTGFQVSWIDRYPPVNPPELPVFPPQLFLFPDESAHNEFVPEVFPPAAYVDMLVAPAKQNRSNRLRYRCPHCKSQVWGKPRLRILCGGDSCETAVFQVSPAGHAGTPCSEGLGSG